jgi:hypothetical protein
MLAIVRPRLKAWLLVGLLAFVAQFGVTVSQVSPPRHPHAIVFVDRADAEEARLEAKPKPAAQSSVVVLPQPAAPRPVASQDPKLFQRPPPSLLLRA